MAKKPKSIKKTTSSVNNSQAPVRSSGGSGIEKALIENFVAIQRVMVNLSGKIDNLTTQISKLLELFEISAKALAEKNFQIGDTKGNQKIVEKIDTLLDQNKTIARGLTLMHEVNSRQGNPSGYPSQERQAPIEPPIGETGITGYQKSIASEENQGSFESPVSEKLQLKRLPKG